MRFIGFSLIITLLFGSLACKKYTVPEKEIPENNGSGIDALNVPEDFTWNTAKEFNPTITFQGSLANQFLVLEVLDDKFNRIQKYFKPSTDAVVTIDQQITAQIDTAYLFCAKANLFLPFATNERNVKVNDPQQARQIRATFQSKNISESHFKSACPNGNGIRTVNNNGGGIIVGNNEHVKVTSNYTGDLRFEGAGTLSICGNVSINKIDFWGGDQAVSIIVHNGGRLTSSKLKQLNGDTKTLTNHGIVELSSELQLNGATVINHGQFYCQKMDINGGGSFENLNEAQATIDGDCKVNTGDFINAGTCNINKKLEVNSGANLENYCSLEVDGDLKCNKTLTNSGSIKVTKKAEFNSGANLLLADRSICIVNELVMNGPSISSGFGGPGVGVFKVSNKTTLNSLSINQGFIDVCDATGIETNNLNQQSDALVKKCETTVSTDECISEGIISEQDPDGDDDGDGVGNGEDDDDEDENVAASFSYPSSGFAFRSYEDLWPSRGDYDFNDMVLKYKFDIYTKKNNKVTKLVLDIEIKAIGAGHDNGIALQLLTKTGGEFVRYDGSIFSDMNAGATVDPQDQSVAILCDNIFDFLPNKYKNDGEGPDGQPHRYTIEFNINQGANIDGSSLIPDLFIFRSANRGLEIHLPGVPPSGAADPSLFNTKEDNSAPGRYYKTAENYPWGMEVLGAESFLHPRSKISIISAYPDFSDWVNSNGAQQLDWYARPEIPLCY
ncbi:MAG: LruC domain-containing protein [Luteibaculum sp.]